MLILNRRQVMLLGALPLFLSFLTVAVGHAEEAPAGPPKQSFLPLGDFTVNLHDKTGQYGFIVIGVTLDVAPQSAALLKDVMPRLKEALTRRLMALADRGALMPGETDPIILKASLADALKKINPDGINEVLITRLIYG